LTHSYLLILSNLKTNFVNGQNASAGDEFDERGVITIRVLQNVEELQPIGLALHHLRVHGDVLSEELAGDLLLQELHLVG
jgi:hypothetical protein